MIYHSAEGYKNIFLATYAKVPAITDQILIDILNQLEILNFNILDTGSQLVVKLTIDGTAGNGAIGTTIIHALPNNTRVTQIISSLDSGNTPLTHPNSSNPCKFYYTLDTQGDILEPAFAISTDDQNAQLIVTVDTIPTITDAANRNLLLNVAGDDISGTLVLFIRYITLP